MMGVFRLARRGPATLVLAGATLAVGALAADLPSKAPNVGSVANTRHNLTQQYLGVGKAWMDFSRNDYGEVCVYCHTPHGSSQAVALPLWNRTTAPTSYTVYNLMGKSSAGGTVTQPGANSLSCLSCHDGQVAIDSIINMPGSGRYLASQAISVNESFLATWPGGPSQYWYGGHGTLQVSDAAFNRYGECQSCHSVDGPQNDPATTTSFDVFYISTDLRNDHPVGVQYPSRVDFKPLGVQLGRVAFFDKNANGRMEKDEIRLYDTGEGYEVECATCHDPHGVPSSGKGSGFLPSFLRVSNSISGLCLTCHDM